MGPKASRECLYKRDTMEKRHRGEGDVKMDQREIIVTIQGCQQSPEVASARKWILP